jgi:rubrerythrin
MSTIERDEDVADSIGRAFLAQLVASPEGRAHLLSISVDAEEGDEGDLFGQLAEFVEDPKLRRIVERHRDDEVRHALLYRGCLDRLGLEKQEIPDELKIIRQIAAATGRSDVSITAPSDVVATYALLYVIEQRGVERFPRIADAFREVDPETADVYERVTRDERGHVRYCETVGSSYAADAGEWQEAVARARALEEEAFFAVGLANIAYCADRGWVQLDDAGLPTT